MSHNGDIKSEGRGFRRIRALAAPDRTLQTERLADASRRLVDSMPRVPLSVEPPPDLHGPAVRSAEAAERTVDIIAEMKAATEAMVLLNQQSLALSESARVAAARSERFAKVISWISVAISFASLIAAVVAIVVSR